MILDISEKSKKINMTPLSFLWSAAIRWLDSSGIEAVNAAAGGTFGRLRLYLLKERKKSLGEI